MKYLQIYLAQTSNHKEPRAFGRHNIFNRKLLINSNEYYMKSVSVYVCTHKWVCQLSHRIFHRKFKALSRICRSKLKFCKETSSTNKRIMCAVTHKKIFKITHKHFIHSTCVTTLNIVSFVSCWCSLIATSMLLCF